MIKGIDKIVRVIARGIFFILICFELLNAFGFLNFQIVFTWLGLFLTASVVWIMVEIASWFLNLKTKTKLPGWVFLISAAAVYVDAFGDILGGYFLFNWYDQVAHFLGGGATAGLVFSFLYFLNKKNIIKIGKISFFIFSVSVTGFLGSLYEIEEYLEDLFRGSQRLGSGFDTANDMLLNFLGALVVVALVMLIKKKNEKT